MTIGVGSTAESRGSVRRLLARRFDLVLILCGSRGCRPRRLSATWDNDWGSFPDSTLCVIVALLFSFFVWSFFVWSRLPRVLSSPRRRRDLRRRPRIPWHRLSQRRLTRQLPERPRRRLRTR